VLEVLCKATVSVEPGECPLDDPSPWQQLEAFCRVGLFDDFQCTFSDFGERVLELVAGISAIGEHVPQPWEPIDDGSQHLRRAVAILNIGGVNRGVEEIAAVIGEDMALPAFDLLARIIAPCATVFVVLTL
jgi:hypothetical protein